MFLHCPSGREDDEIACRNTRLCRRTRKNSEDRRIHMIELDGTERTETIQIVHVGNIISMPCDDIVRGMTAVEVEKLADELLNQHEVALAIFELSS